MKFEEKYFRKLNFTTVQIEKYFDNALKDIRIAKQDDFREVRFNYTYTAFIKAGITLLSYYGAKVRSVPGHHVKIIERMAEILEDENVMTVGNLMRSKRNLDFYDGGIDVTAKECKEYLEFVGKILNKIEKMIFRGKYRRLLEGYEIK